jgi:hypothetical protein
MPWLDDPRLQPQVVLAALRADLGLVDVEPKRIQPLQSFLDPEARVRGERHFLDELGPEPVVAPVELLGRTDRVHVVDQPLGSDVEQLADDVLLGHHHVLETLAVAELGMELACLSVDHVGAKGARVPAEQRVGE